MKMYKKSDLVLINGTLVSESTGDVIVPSPAIVLQANELETLSQKAKYLSAQPDATPMPSLDGFKRKSINDNDDTKFSVDTPHLDRQAYETMMMLDEMDDTCVVNKANEMLKDFSDLVTFVKNDYVVDCAGGNFATFDTPTLGSVLELTVDDIMNVVAMACGLESEEPTKMKRIGAEDLSEEEKAMLLSIIANHDEEAAKILNDTGDIKADIVKDEDVVEE
jgi:hypothetical protein